MKPLDKLIPAAIKGDESAFNQLYEISFPVVEAECLRVLRNSFDAEDAIQETYINIGKGLKKLGDPDKFPAWCRTIAHNSAVDLISQRQRKTGQDDYRPNVSGNGYTGLDVLEDEKISGNPEKETDQAAIRLMLQEVMDDLSPTRAMCLSLYYQGYSYKEIAQELSIPEGTVKSDIHYGKQALREKIKEIEKRDGTKIHGFTLVPVQGKVEVRMGGPQDNFIHAETSLSSDAKKEIWRDLSRRLSQLGLLKASFWKKIWAVALALLVILGGIFFMITFMGRNNPNPQPSQGVRTGQGTRQGENGQGQNGRQGRGAQGQNVRQNQGPNGQAQNALAPQNLAPAGNVVPNGPAGGGVTPGNTPGNANNPAATPANNQGFVNRIAQVVNQIADDDEAAVNSSNNLAELAPKVVDNIRRAYNDTEQIIEEEAPNIRQGNLFGGSTQ